MPQNHVLYNLLIFIVLLVSFQGKAQNSSTNNDTMETFVATGNNVSGANGSITYSIGQVFYTYIENQSVYNIAQGIQHQVSGESLSIPEVEKSTTQVFVYPNPTTDFVTLKMEGLALENQEKTYFIYDLQGKLLKKSTITNDEAQISFDNLSPSIYILIITSQNRIIEKFKIIKK